MHRRGGKRIRMDDPPPEYVNPMTPATPSTDHGGQSVHEPETPNPGYAGFTAGAGAAVNSTGAEREEADESHEEEIEVATPTKRVTRSRGRGGDAGCVGRLAESPPPMPVVRRGRGRGRGRGRARGAAAPPPAASPPPVLLPGDDENSLYNILRFNKTAINQVVDLWIEQYKSVREVALVQLMQLFINSSGCRGRVTPDMAQMDHTLIIKKMTQEFDEESGEYPLIMSGQTWKKFRSNLCEFIQTLVKMCQYSIIYDQYLMDNIISLLTGLSDSQVRAFRHTATLAVMKLMTALVDVALLTSINCDNCLRQYEAERLKARDKRATDRLEVLVAKRQELEENMEEIKNMLSYMFKSVFVHRYRDTLPDIRAITMSEIGIWMEKFPAHFLDDLYLKYIGWTLHDKVGEVRLRCLLALQPLYSCDELKAKLELFTSKFKDRIVAMTLDREPDVAVHAVKLVIAILKMHPDVLTDKDCEHVYELVYSQQRGVAAAAGEFLNVRLFRGQEDAPTTRSKRGKERLPNTPLLRDLVQFFIESELHEHGAYLVDSLIESHPMMKDWECMTDLLLEEAGPGEEPLDNRQEASLVELMTCCVRQASSGEPPVGRAPPRRGAPPPKESARAVAEDRARLTAHFIHALPPLLERFSADPDKLANLVTVPQYFDLDLYTTQRQEGNLSLLLSKLCDTLGVSTEVEVVEGCARTLDALCGGGHANATRCAVARATATDTIANKYKEAIDDYRSLIEGGETPDADETFAVVNSLRKLAILSSCHNVNGSRVWDSLLEDLPKAVNANATHPPAMPDQALVYVIRSMFYSLLWSLDEVEERLGGGDGVMALRERLHQYVAMCQQVVADPLTQQLKEEAYTSLCDLLLVFPSWLGSQSGQSAALKPLALNPEPHVHDLLNQFVQEHVFVHNTYDGQDERRIEELHKRRNLLAAYCKLIVYNVAPVRRAADVFKHYIKCYNDYGDIIKATLSKAREIGKQSCALAMVLAMQALFTTARDNCAPATLVRTTPEMHELKELAKRFSVMFGLDAVKSREALVALHRAGVSFAAVDSHRQPPPNLLFLEALAEFSTRLLRQDKRHLLKLVESRIPHSSVQWGEEWSPLHCYRTSLQTDGPENRPHPARSYGHSKKTQRGAEDSEPEEHPDSEPEQQQIGRRAPRLRPRPRPRPRLRVLSVSSRPPRRRLHSPSPSPSPNVSQYPSPNVRQYPSPDVSQYPSPASLSSAAADHVHMTVQAEVHRYDTRYGRRAHIDTEDAHNGGADDSSDGIATTPTGRRETTLDMVERVASSEGAKSSSRPSDTDIERERESREAAIESDATDTSVLQRCANVTVRRKASRADLDLHKGHMYIGSGSGSGTEASAGAKRRRLDAPAPAPAPAGQMTFSTNRRTVDEYDRSSGSDPMSLTSPERGVITTDTDKDWL